MRCDFRPHDRDRTTERMEGVWGNSYLTLTTSKYRAFAHAISPEAQDLGRPTSLQRGSRFWEPSRRFPEPVFYFYTNFIVFFRFYFLFFCFISLILFSVSFSSFFFLCVLFSFFLFRKLFEQFKICSYF